MSTVEPASPSSNEASTSAVGLQEERIDVHEADHPLSSSSKTSHSNLPFSATFPSNQGNVPTLLASPTITAPHLPPHSIVRDNEGRLGSTNENIAAPQPLQDASTEARNVRRNMLLAAWNGFTLLTKGRKWILLLRMLIGLAQLVVGIAILSLPTSLGDSFSTPETCDPEGMFVFLTLHTIRVFFSVPVDFYLGLSPHRTPSARRVGSEGQIERERTRMLGSLALDRKMSRFSDLLGLCHIVLFIVGNYIVWTSIECSHSPAESRPLFIACVCMLSVTYMIIVEVMLMILLLVFFLPLLLTILRALGLASHLPQRGIHPETGKIDQSTIDEQSRLVYFTLAREDGQFDATETNTRGSRDDLERLDAGSFKRSLSVDQDLEAATIPLPLSKTSTIQSKAPSQRSLASRSRPSKRKRLGLLFGYSRRGGEDRNQNRTNTDQIDGTKVKENQVEANGSDTLKYPLYPMPAHRATCPICLCDFDDARLGHQRSFVRKASISNIAEAADVRTNSENNEGLEPLRLLNCGHVMHMACVDQWLTTVSGRCPVCQKPLVAEAGSATL